MGAGCKIGRNSCYHCQGSYGYFVNHTNMGAMTSLPIEGKWCVRSREECRCNSGLYKSLSHHAAHCATEISKWSIFKKSSKKKTEFIGPIYRRFRIDGRSLARMRFKIICNTLIGPSKRRKKNTKTPIDCNHQPTQKQPQHQKEKKNKRKKWINWWMMNDIRSNKPTLLSSKNRIPQTKPMLHTQKEKHEWKNRKFIFPTRKMLCQYHLKISSYGSINKACCEVRLRNLHPTNGNSRKEKRKHIDWKRLRQHNKRRAKSRNEIPNKTTLKMENQENYTEPHRF